MNYGMILMTAVAVFCSLAGLFFILKAIWVLRVGMDEPRFIMRGMIGMILLVLPWVLFPLIALGMSSTIVRNDNTFASSSIQTMPQGN